MEAKLLDIVAQKTTDPAQLADLQKLRRFAVAVADLERDQGDDLPANRDEAAMNLDQEDEKGRVFGLQSRFCRRADSAIEAVESIAEFERDELEFLSLLSQLASQREQARLEPLIQCKEQLVVGMEVFVDTWK